MMKFHHRIVGTGLFALDVIVDPDGTITTSALGGSAGNVLSILGALGWHASPVGTLGDDAAARVVQQGFADVGADVSFIRRSGDRSTPVVYQHQLRSRGTRTHQFSFACPTCGRDRRPHWDDDVSLMEERAVLPRASVFFLDRATPLGVALAQHYAERGALVIFEPSAIGSDAGLFAAALRWAHVIKYADDRISSLEGFDLQSVRVEIQTSGSRGLRFRAQPCSEEWLTLDAYELPHVHDTAGAGDWCTAGLIYELFSQGETLAASVDYDVLRQALLFGQALSTLNCITEGARGLLAAWKPVEIVRSARELSSIRLRAFDDQQSRILRESCDLKLKGLADDARRRASPVQLGAHPVLCCTTP